MASKPFTDTFLPSLLGGLSEVGPAMVQGMIGAEQLQRDRELHQAQMANQRSLEALRLKQAVFYGQPKQTPELQALMALQSGLASDPDYLNTPEGRMYSLFGKHSMMPRNVGGMLYNPMTGEMSGVPKDEFSRKALELGYDPMRMNAASIGAVNQALRTQDSEKAKSKESGRIAAQLESSEGALSDAALDFMARQALAGDTSVYQNLGRGMQGSKNLVRLREKVQALSTGQGIAPSELAARNAEFFGLRAAERTLGNRQANFGMAQAEAQQMAGLVLDASNAVSRTRFPLVNEALNAYYKNTGDPKIIQFGSSVNSFINAYARAISPTGVPTVSDKEHAREMLNTAQSAQQVQANIQQLMREMEAAGQAPGLVHGELRQGFMGGPPTKTPPPPATPPASPLLQSSPLYQQRGQATQKPDLYAGLDKIMTNKAMKPEEVFSSAEFSKLPSGKQSQLESFYKRFASGEIDKAALSHAVHGILDEAWGNVRAELAARVLAGGQP